MKQNKSKINNNSKSKTISDFSDTRDIILNNLNVQPDWINGLNIT